MIVRFIIILREMKTRPKESSRHKHLLTNSKKHPNRKQPVRKVEPSWDDLFESARMPLTKGEKAELVSSTNNNKFEESTASR